MTKFDGNLRVVQCNLQRSRAAQLEFIQTFQTSDVHVAFICEPYVGKQSFVNNIPGTTVIQFLTAERVKACVLVKDGVAKSILGRRELSTSNLAVVEIKLGHKSLVLGSIYIEPNTDFHNTFAALDKLMSGTSSRCTVIGGDFNADHILWNCNKNDSRGDDIAALCAHQNFHVCNKGNVPTFEVVRGGKLLSGIDDLTLVSDSILTNIKQWKVDRGICPCSDHNAITFTVVDLPKGPDRHMNSTFRFKSSSADWSKFASALKNDNNLEELINSDLSTLRFNCLDEAVATMTAAIHRACDASMKRRGLKAGPKRNPWWTTELDNIKKEVIRLHHLVRTLKQNGGDMTAALLEYAEKKITYAQAIRDASGRNFRDFCTAQGKEDVWAITNRLLKKTVAPSSFPSTVPNSSGSTTSNAETARVILDYFYPDVAANTANVAAPSPLSPHAATYEVEELSLTVQEVISCMKTFNPKKAPGPDHLTADICFQFILTFPDFMTALLNRCLEVGHFPTCWKVAAICLIPKPGKSDPSLPSSFRPIGLLPVFGKLFEKLFLRRFTHGCITGNRWSSRQYGFRQQTSTTHAIRDLVDFVRLGKAKKKKVIAVSLDIQGAFNNARWPDILRGLRNSGCSVTIYNVIVSYFRDRVVVLCHGDATVSKTMSKGCIQGSVCGPTFWNLIVEDLLAFHLPPNVRIQAYADDIIVLIHGDSVAELERTAAAVLRLVEKWGNTNRLTFSADKTQWISFTKSSDDACIKLGDSIITRTSVLKVLGVLLDQRLSFFAHIRHAIQKATRVYKALCIYVRPTWGLHSDNIETIYRCVIEPMITYAAGIWGKTAERPTAKKLLTSFQRLFAIKAIRGFRTVSATSACALAQFVPLHLKIKEIYLLDTVKKTKRCSFLPRDVELEVRTPPAQQLHPREQQRIEFQVVTNQAEADAIGGKISVYTDGSKLANGDTGAAVVVYKETGSKVVTKLKLSKWSTVFQAEMFAIFQAMEWLKLNCFGATISLYTDSLSSLLAIQNCSDHPLVTKILHLITWVHERNGCQILLLKVSAHCGIAGNEEADAQAKAAAASHRASQYSYFPLSYAKRQIQENIMREWQEEYQSAATGSTTRQTFPNIKCIETYKKVARLTFATTQFFTGHGYFKSYLHRFHIIADAWCPCDGFSIQTPQHVIAVCTRYAAIRSRFETLCASYDVSAEEVPRTNRNPVLLSSYVSFCTSIVNSLKAFNGT